VLGLVISVSVLINTLSTFIPELGVLLGDFSIKMFMPRLFGDYGRGLLAKCPNSEASLSSCKLINWVL